MQWFRADFHIHSVLSPCGNLDMSPAQIILEAKKKGLDIIGITDHNATHHAELMVELGKNKGITVIPGVEVNTQEEVHCLAFFENTDGTKRFQQFLSKHKTSIQNNPDRFGMQLVVNEKEEILDELPELLIAAIRSGITEVEQTVHQIGGLFIAAHIDRPMYGIYSQIGFIPDNLVLDAIEISNAKELGHILKLRPELHDYTIISNSDAHNLTQVGANVTELLMNEPSFLEVSLALQGKGGRQVRVGHNKDLKPTTI